MCGMSLKATGGVVDDVGKYSTCTCCLIVSEKALGVF